jgi:hypothetical protein
MSTVEIGLNFENASISESTWSVNMAWYDEGIRNVIKMDPKRNPFWGRRL